jgi:membrane-bound lytic murein transglycosylase MltF
MVEFFKKYAGQYGFDYLMVIAQGYQESRLDQSVRSPAGAIGVMQLLPSTAGDPAVNIPNIEELEPNIHAGIKYLHHIYNTHFEDTEMDDINKGLFAFASYNAGPTRIAQLREKAAEEGLDPKIWFYNVELVVAREVGRETVQYVSNIYKYYLAYRLIAEREM